ncbi:MAG: hypothetical protein OXL95_05495 [Nitrospira sp.]|nr:hypothetical protein [Nitrospira sp.]
MDTWKTYGIGVALLIIVSYGGFQLVSSSVANLNEKVNAVYTDLGRTQERFEELDKKAKELDKKANTLEEKSQSISTSLEKVKQEPSVKVGELLGDLENYPQAKNLIEKVGQLSKNVKSLDSKKLICNAKPREDHKGYASCDADYYELAKWCSGDCNADDAKVTLCCKYK